MANKWKDMDDDDRKYFWEDTSKELNHIRKLADEAFIRKSKFLTASNAGGVIAVISYLGAIKPEMDLYILVTLSMFLLGMIINGIVMFMAEKRFMNYLDGASSLRELFTQDESDMTIDKYNENIFNLYQTAEWEDRLEITSGICFLIAVATILIGMISKIY